MTRRIPDAIEGYGPVRPFAGALANIGAVRRAPVSVCSARPGTTKVLPSLRAAIEACGLRSGATVSFHHHLRNGDDVLRAVMAEIAALGLRDIRVAASSIFPVHAPLAEHMRSGVVTGIATGYMSGAVAEAVARGWLATPAVMQTHGGRARAIESGDLHIDVAFVRRAHGRHLWEPQRRGGEVGVRDIGLSDGRREVRRQGRRGHRQSRALPRLSDRHHAG